MAARQATGTVLLGRSAVRLVVALALLIGALGVALGVTSANDPPVGVTITDDPSGTACNGAVRIDRSCDLLVTANMRKPDDNGGFYTLVVTGDDGAFDDSSISPTTKLNKTIGDCPCIYRINFGQTQQHKIRMTPRNISPSHLNTRVAVHSGPGTDTAAIATYDLRLIYVPQETRLKLGRIADTSVELKWTVDRLMNWVMISWKTKSQTTFPSSQTAVQRAAVRAHQISGLTANTEYVLKVVFTRTTWPDDPPEPAEVTFTTPILVEPCTQSGAAIDYDGDNDGLIEVCNLDQLNAIRYDLNGDGIPEPNTGHTNEYATAFPNAADDMGCPEFGVYQGCKGYELAANLDFDDDGNADGFSSGDSYWNNGKGWIPIAGNHRRDLCPPGDDPLLQYDDRCISRYSAIFEGNGRTIANLSILDADRRFSGLFGQVGLYKRLLEVPKPGETDDPHGTLRGIVRIWKEQGLIRNVGLTGVGTVKGSSYVGGLVGKLEYSQVRGSYSLLDVEAGMSVVGGLVGGTDHSAVVESYATGDVRNNSFSSREVGGLIGALQSSSYVSASFASGSVVVSGRNTCEVGGLVGFQSYSAIVASYSTGQVEVAGCTRNAGSMSGHQANVATTVASYSTGLVVTSDSRSTGIGRLSGMCSGFAYNRVSYWLVPAADTSKGIHDSNRNCLADGAANSNYYGQTFVNSSQGRSESELKAPTGYQGIYEQWQVELSVPAIEDGWFYHWHHPLRQAADLELWDFGTNEQYPILKHCAVKPGIDRADGDPYCPLREVMQHGRKSQ